MCPLLLVFSHDQPALWSHSFHVYSPPTVLCLFSGSSARSAVFTGEAGSCLLYHTWYLTPHFPSRLSQAAGTALCSIALLANPCSTKLKACSPSYKHLLSVALWKICFKPFNSGCYSRSIHDCAIRRQLTGAAPKSS